jgi:DNA recombination protein RmuC
MVWEFIVGAVVGGIAGYFLGKYLAYKRTDISEKSALLSSLTNQVTEMKAKFDSYESIRAQKEKDMDQFYLQREKRYHDFMESTKKFFETQDKFRLSSEEKRDKQLENFSNVIASFNRTIHGTKTRGLMGEDILKQYLREPIKAKLVKTELTTDTGVVEFAWNLGDGMYIPIDSKFPDIIALIESINDDSSQSEKNEVQKKIFTKIKKEVDTVKKYQNQSNTINKCILVVPESSLELSPEIIEYGSQKNVFVCSPNHVFFVGYIISEEYAKMKEEGDLGSLKETNKSLIGIIKEILGLSDTIDRQANSVLKHSSIIKDKVHEALRL